MSKNVRRRGFTLPEVLVTITIVAVLAAVVVPAVLNQVNKGDTAGLAGDVDALRSAISNFTTDTRHYPALIEDLIEKPQATDKDLFSADYGTSAINAWKGPYFPTSQAVSSTTPYTTTAFGLTIADTLRAPNDSTANFITLVFQAMPTPEQIAQIDRLFDGGNGTVPAGTGADGCATTTGNTGNNVGQIRWTESATGACTITAMSWRLVSAAQ